jgi:glutamyl-tRNA reductase
VSVVVVGANHRTAPLDLLERMAVSGDLLPKMLHSLDAGADTSEVVVLATCNRTEVYLIAERFHGAYAEVRDFFADLTFLPPDRFAENLYVHYDDAAIRHVFEVAAGLDSAVPGEHEILGQVRTAWDLAREEGTARRGLNLLFRHALEVGKRARTETSISRHVTSVSQAAVILAGERLAELRQVGSTHGAGGDADGTEAPAACTAAAARAGLAGARAVVVGAGSMGRGTASFLVDAGVERIVVANRSVERGHDLIDGVAGGTDGVASAAVGLDGLTAAMADADVVVAATGAAGTVITADMVAPALVGRDRPLVIVDIAMPRDVEHAVGDLDGVELLDMDAVAAFTEAGIAGRRREVTAVREIVDQEIVRYHGASNARSVAPVITALRDQAEQVRCAEIERASSRLSGLSDAQRDAVESITRGLVAKLLHEPTVRLRGAAGSARGERLADSIRDLFDLAEAPADLPEAQDGIATAPAAADDDVSDSGAGSAPQA